MKKGVYYSITILSDFGSWMDPWISQLSTQWQKNGHAVIWDKSIANAPGGDFCFCLGLSQIIPEDILKIYKNTLVVHESNLPQGRGWAPMSWQILEGRAQIVVSLIEAATSVDTGPIHLQDTINLNGTELNSEWRELQAISTINLCNRWVESYPFVLLGTRIQNGVPSYYKKRTPLDSQLDPEKSLLEQFNLLRIVDNDRYPAFVIMCGQKYQLRISKMD